MPATQSFDAEAEPTLVPMPEAGSAPVVRVACGEQCSAVLLEDQSVWLWGMRRYFEPTQLPKPPGLMSPDDPVVDLQCGASHLALLTQSGRLFTYGQGTALAMPKASRKSWELAEVGGFDGRRAPPPSRTPPPPAPSGLAPRPFTGQYSRWRAARTRLQ